MKGEGGGWLEVGCGGAGLGLGFGARWGAVHVFANVFHTAMLVFSLRVFVMEIIEQ